MKNIHLLQNKTIRFLFIFSILLTFSACTSDDDSSDPILEEFNEPIVLDCNFFQQPRVLTNDPLAPVDYVVTCVMQVRAAITVEPGVVIEFRENAGLNIDDFHTADGSLKAIGTADKPIVFRGVNNTKGYWRGIMFDSASTLNELTHSFVEDAGGQSFNSNGNRAAVHVYADGRLKMTNTTVSNSETYALDATYSGSIFTLQNNKFINNNAPVIINPSYIQSLNATNTYQGNTNDFAYIQSGSFNSATLWQKIDIPYVVTNSSIYNYSGGIVANNVLTVEPGVHVENEAGVMYKIQENGGIKAVGTSSNPIIFTAVNKVVNGWIGIYLDSENPLNEIGNAEFHYSGKTTGSGGSASGSIRLWYNNVLNIHNVTFKNINGCAINYGIFPSQSGNPLLNYSNITVDPGACLIKCFGNPALCG